VRAAGPMAARHGRTAGRAQDAAPARAGANAGRGRFTGHARTALIADSPGHGTSLPCESAATRRISRLAGHTPVDHSVIDLGDAERALRHQRRLAARTADHPRQHGKSPHLASSPHRGGCR
jgi:hypothetical protein